MADMFQVILHNLFLIGVLSLSTLGITLTFKTANTANFAQAIMSTVGAFSFAYLLTRLEMGPWISLVGGVILTFITGWAVDALVVNKMKSGPIGRVMVTLGLILIVTEGISMFFGMIPYTVPRFFDGNVIFTLAGTEFLVSQNALFIFGTSMTIIAAVFVALYKTKWGLSVRATAANDVVASMLGINTKRLTALSWGLSSAIAALAAIFLGSQQTNVNINMMAVVGTNSMLAFVVGGYTSFYGPVVGAFIVPILLSILAMVSGLWANALLYIVVLLVILIKPMGIFGKETVEKV